ncbi:diguanylate cyclase (GGDEF)-like protein [Silvibacterium bohemicum]|uniref:Diguanylate cyclase (GGDEF)-like protein n=1 Tax=Silvibacterium bohemicum TaxID=1577686 RepID=A0A841JNC5_9BACT|nr:bifunctional diguanylate cyclase/phosphodiesterase [Silvibacterium bohemicum]MBB6142640.1 diguanylate cyclase (GGDEF)-like protein [Silvibacterium bohemicum]
MSPSIRQHPKHSISWITGCTSLLALSIGAALRHPLSLWLQQDRWEIPGQLRERIQEWGQTNIPEPLRQWLPPFTWRAAAIGVAGVLGWLLLFLLVERLSIELRALGFRRDRFKVNRLLEEQHVARAQDEALSREIRERKWMEAKLLHLAFHDTLTGLGNRGFLLDLLKARLETKHKFARSKGFLIYIDLDRFRTVNDMFGHRLGDELLRQIADRLKNCISDEDFLVRIGQDEFAILLGALRDTEQVARTAAHILQVMERPVTLCEMSFPLTASIGVSAIHAHHAAGEEVLHAADTAMSRAKRRGGNCYVFYDTAMHDDALSKIQTTLQLQTALEREEMELYYQPIINLRDGSIAGVEALLRWNHPTRGLLTPGTFICLAEETSSIVPIGSWAMRRSCQDIRRMREVLGRDLLLSVNISAKQLNEPSFLPTLIGLVDDWEGDPRFLQLEITESIFVNDADRVGDLLHTIRSRGVRIALDDFGTGYSSLGYLRNYPIDTLKIDQSFVRDMGSGSINSDIIRFIVDLAHGAGMKVVAEGIEAESQAEMLMEYGCRFAQGYFYSRPLPLPALLRRMEHEAPIPFFEEP